MASHFDQYRNPLTSLKSASEVLEGTSEGEKRKKLIKVISHDVERIERLITDYSQMLKDEASLSRAKMKKIDLSHVISSVVEDFNSDLLNLDKNIKIWEFLRILRPSCKSFRYLARMKFGKQIKTQNI